MGTEKNEISVAKDKLRGLLESIPFLTFDIEERPALRNPPGLLYPDVMVSVRTGKNNFRLLCEVKTMVQPRQTRAAILELKGLQNMLQDEPVCPLLIAPFISKESATICSEAGVSYLDFAGNCRVIFDHIYIERSGAANPKKEKRSLRTLFSPKASRVLRCMLEEPTRSWLVEEVKEATGVSLGLVSNVRKSLLDKEWAQVKENGLVLTKPNAVLDAWKDVYERKMASSSQYYTMLSGEILDAMIKVALQKTGASNHILLASFSAAKWLAPFSRYPKHIFYADEMGESRLCDLLQLKRTGKGENIVVERPHDKHLLKEGIEAAPDIWCTGLVQTYLDLNIAGERGEEAADHLRKLRIEPLWKEAE